MKKIVTLLVVSAGIALLAACGKPKPFQAVGSCVSYADSSCWDLAVVNSQVKSICSGGSFDLKPTPCSKVGVLAGCRKDNMIMWYSPTSDVKTPADVKKKCLSGAKLVDPAGNEIEQ